jgi:hypothetical protein
LEDFIDQEVTSLFIIELEDIGNFRRTHDYGFPLWIKKKKEKSITVGNSEIIDCFKHLEDIKVYESSSHEEGKRLFKTLIRTNIFTFYYY